MIYAAQKSRFSRGRREVKKFVALHTNAARRPFVNSPLEELQQKCRFKAKEFASFVHLEFYSLIV
jgi:hypothetical protein